MAGRNNKKGRSSGGGGQAPAKQRAFQYQPSLYDKKDQKTVATLKRALAYERKNGATDEPHMQRLQGRLNAKINEISKRTGTKKGIRLDVRSKAAAAANYRQKVRNIQDRANNASGAAYNRMTTAQKATSWRAGALLPARSTLSRRVVTRGQGDLFTGGFSGKTGNTMRPVIRNGKGTAGSRATRKNTVRV
jgi:hypothetical protein